MKVKITKLARSDIRNMFAHIKSVAGDHKAREITAEIREKCHGLNRMPERFQKLEGFEAIGLRRRIYRDYLIIYRIKNTQIEILRIIHGAAEIEKILNTMK